MPAASLRALLEHAIDYAGLFPPASLSLQPALRNHAEYVRTPDAWMLGAFILPVAQFDAVSPDLSQFDQKYPLRISALGTKTENSSDFRAALAAAMAAIQAATMHLEILAIHQLEMLLPNDADSRLLAEARSAIGKLPAFWETSADEAERTIALLAEHNSDSGSATFGYKLRTGGVAVDAFPTSQQIACALVAAAEHRVPIKFTAGLHHPLRQFRAEVQTKMHGFLNVLGAAILAAEHGWDPQQTSTMLEDENASSFSFDDVAFAWRDWKIATDEIIARRKMVTSFGSCSFDEPREDLRALNLL